MMGVETETIESIKRIVLPVLLIISSLFLLGWVTWFINTRLPKPENGPTPDVPASHTILLIDQTDTLSERCIIQLEQLLESMPKTIGTGEMLSIFSIHSDSDIAITPLLSVYNSGLGSNEWIENLKMKRDRFVKSFMAPIIDFSKSIRQRPASPSSPIIETVNRLLRWDKFSAKTRRRKLIIYSDMLQNSMNCSDYPTSTIVYEGSPGCPELRPMDRVRVDIRYIIRPERHALQTGEHRQTWLERFRRAGAAVTLDRTL